MNREQILNEIEKTKQHLANMEKMLEDKEWEEKAQRWKPKANEKYWYVTSTNHTAQTDFVSTGCYKTEDDFQRWLIYNCFKTEKEANQEAENLLIRRHLQDIARRLNRGRKIDWNNQEQDKYFIRFSYWEDRIRLETCWKNKVQGVIYCLDKKFLDVATQEIGKERLEKYLKGN